MMKTQIEITSEELNRYIQYEKLLRRKPCLNACDATERSTCCGCPAQHEWNKKIKALNIDDYRKAGVIADFAKAYVSYTEIEKDYERVQLKMNEAERLLDCLRSQIHIIK